MVMGQMGPMTVMASERNTGSEAVNAASSEDGWSDVPVESPNAWDAEWYGCGRCLYL